MKTLMINDLPVVDVLDRETMASITGGTAIDQRISDLIAAILRAAHPAGGLDPGIDPGFDPGFDRGRLQPATITSSRIIGN